MKPRDTTYRLVTRPQEYQRCHQFLKDQGYDEPRLTYPSIMAQRGEELIGVLATQPRSDAIVAGPVAVSKGGLITAIRLFEAYERLLWHSGVRSYYFGVEKANTSWIEQLNRFGLIACQVTDEAVWYQ